MTALAIVRDSCAALLAERFRQPTLDNVHKAGWLAAGTGWIEICSQFTSKTPTLDSPAMVVAYGMSPRSVSKTVARPRSIIEIQERERYNANALRASNISHPLHLAIMFQKLLGDTREASWLLGAYEALPKARAFGDFWNATWIPPYRPENLGRTAFDEPRSPDSMSMLHWMNPHEVQRLLGDSVNQSSIVEAVNTCVRLGVELNLSEPLGVILAQLWKEYRIHAPLLADLIRITSYSHAYQLLRGARGVKAALGIVRSDTSEELMIRGLRQISAMTAEARKDLAALYGRAPTIKELKAVRGSGLIDILYYMPWSLLSGLVTNHGSELRAMTLPHLAHLTGDRRYCLQDHDGRASLRSYAGRDVAKPSRVTTNTNDSDWMLVFGGLSREYQQSIAIRQALLEATEDPSVAVVSLLPPFEALSPTSVARVLQHHPNYTRIMEVVKGIRAPVFTAEQLKTKSVMAQTVQ